MPSGFNSETISLGQLLADPFTFRIPDYQRPYSWTTKEAEQLLDDLYLELDAASLEEPEAGYFLGAVLLMEHEVSAVTDGSTSRVYDIVDGQQRLVTITILLAVIRDLIAEEGGSAEELSHPRLWTRSDVGEIPRIILRGRDGEFLRAHVQQPGASSTMPTDDDLTIGETQILSVREHLAEALFGQSVDDLTRLARYLIDACFFAVITTRTVDRAHRIFSVLNERGRPLARNDILKAQILGAIAAARRGAYTRTWERIERELGGDFESLFSHIRTIEERSRAKVISGIADLVEGGGGPERFFRDVLEPYAEIHSLLMHPAKGHALSPAITRHLTYLGWLSSAEWMPAAMLFWHKHAADAASLEAFLVRLDRLAYGVRLLGLGADKRRSRFLAVLSAVRNGANLDAPDSTLELARDELRNIQYNLRNLHSRSQLTCKLVLLRLNDEISDKPQQLEPGQLTVEHVLPQKPGKQSQWRLWYPTADEREASVQSLGNLVLVTKEENDKARNLELARKQECYFAHGVEQAPAITRALHGLAEWRPEHIKEREDRLLALVNKLWRLDPGRGRAPADAVAEVPPPKRRRKRAKAED